MLWQEWNINSRAFHAPLMVLCNLNTWLLMFLILMLTCWKDVNVHGGEEGEI